MLAASTSRACRSRSMKLAKRAPRDRASRPKAPVPANTSSTRASSQTGAAPNRPWARMLKSASRARSEVGRTALPGGAAMRRPRCLPPTIRMRSHLLRAQLLAQHAARHLLDAAARQMAELEGSIGDPDEARYVEP